MKHAIFALVALMAVGCTTLNSPLTTITPQSTMVQQAQQARTLLATATLAIEVGGEVTGSIKPADEQKLLAASAAISAALDALDRDAAAGNVSQFNAGLDAVNAALAALAAKRTIP